jgi:hypothetical protein
VGSRPDGCARQGRRSCQNAHLPTASAGEAGRRLGRRTERSRAERELQAVLVKRFKKFFALSSDEKRTFLHALVVIPLAAVGLKLCGLDRVQAVLERRAERARKRHSAPAGDTVRQARDISRLVGIAGRRGIWRPDCLERSLVQSYLLQRKGFCPEMRFGCRREENTLCFHAWLEMDGQVINDGADVVDLYKPFPRPEIDRRSHFD